MGPYFRRQPRRIGFPAWLDAERIRADLTIAELASAANISRRTLNNWLQGKTRPQIWAKRSILHFLRSLKVQDPKEHKK